MGALRIDPHAHLYDSYNLECWFGAALSHLGDGGCVIVVDRHGQDSLARLRREASSFATVEDLSSGVGCVVTSQEKKRLLVLRGVQYVASERIEVLGFGIGRSSDDGLSAKELIEAILRQSGTPCLPWSPGKWLGKRGQVVRQLLDSFSPGALTVGDIAIRSWCGPPSSLLAYAARKGFSVVCGTDPLPRTQDQSLVGAFGMTIEGDVPDDVDARARYALQHLAIGNGCRPYGHRNGPVQALSRFFSAL
jgi:hypothetical protein